MAKILPLLFLVLVQGCNLLLPSTLTIVDPKSREEVKLQRSGTKYIVTGRRELSESEQKSFSSKEPESSNLEFPAEEPGKKQSMIKAEQPAAQIKSLPTPVPSSPSGPLAEITPKGDVVHYVTSSDETLIDITEWYTHDRGATGKIARLNNLKPAARLTPGDMVVIPSYLVKNKVRFEVK